MAPEMAEDDMAKDWVRDAMEDERIEAPTARKVVQGQQGEKVFLRDPKDPQANERAMASGYTPVSPNSYTKSAWENIRKAEGAIPRSTDIFGKTLCVGCKPVPKNEWTEGMIRVSALASFVAKKTMNVAIRVSFIESDPCSVVADYGNRRLRFNLTVLPEEWFEPVCSEDQLDLIIHELGHENGGHLTTGYHDALTKMGAKLALMDPDDLKAAALNGKRPVEDGIQEDQNWPSSSS
jgi:hypothetical protein